MSLINSMLKNLEAKETAACPSFSTKDYSQVVENTAGAFTIRVVVILALTLVASASILVNAISNSDNEDGAIKIYAVAEASSQDTTSSDHADVDTTVPIRQAHAVDKSLNQKPDIFVASKETNSIRDVLPPESSQVINSNAEGSSNTEKMTIASFTKTPSKLSAEALDRQQAVEANLLINQGRYQDAERILTEFISSKSPIKAASAHSLAQLYIKTQRTNLTDELLGSVPEIYDSAELRMIKAKWLENKGRYQSASTLLTNGSQAFKDINEYLALSAVLQHKANDFHAASQSYLTLLERDEKNSRWWLGLAIASEAMQENYVAQSSYYQALSYQGLTPNLKTYAAQRLAVLSNPHGA